MDRLSSKKIFYDDFKNGFNNEKWIIAHKNWGGQINTKESFNGGVIPENVTIENEQIVLNVNGNLYNGHLKGINKDGSIKNNGKKTGAAIYTKDYYGAGKYEVRMKLTKNYGICNSIWTFYYDELTPGHKDFKVNKIGGEDYYIINHEIDIELPGRSNNDYSTISYSKALCNTWIGENEDEYKTSFTDLPFIMNDDKFHTYRFDWNIDKGFVDFYIDDIKIQRNIDNIPYIKSRFWIGCWFPKDWAGDPNFETDKMVIDWVKITPFN